MTIGLMTLDFEKYYEVIRLLKEKNVSFLSLESPDRIPQYVNVILTTKEESASLAFPQVVTLDNDLEAAVEKAVNISQGKEVYDRLIIGIDPGQRPGIAVVGDNDVINVYQAVDVFKVRIFIERVLEIYGYKQLLARVGHGSPTQRDHIINDLLDLGLDIEVVDETSTTQGKEARDIKAAINISHSKGRKQFHKTRIEPTAGEVKNLQRISRIESKGDVTIGYQLAESVLKGELTLAGAIEIQKGRPNPKSVPNPGL